MESLLVQRQRRTLSGSDQGLESTYEVPESIHKPTQMDRVLPKCQQPSTCKHLPRENNNTIAVKDTGFKQMQDSLQKQFGRGARSESETSVYSFCSSPSPCFPPSPPAPPPTWCIPSEFRTVLVDEPILATHSWQVECCTFTLVCTLFRGRTRT